MTTSLATTAPPGALSPHKRRPPTGPAFVLPSYGCFACYDTGIVANHDRAINEWLTDYDVLPSGEVAPGSDPAIICCCHAAYPSEGRGGFRDGTGPRRVETLAGARLIGCEIGQDAIAHIHRVRRQRAMEAVPAIAQQARALQAIQGASPIPIGQVLPSMPGSL
jgi:hypothetical protein